MSNANFNTHPIAMVPEWLQTLGPGWVASFSRYQYTPQTIHDKRERFKIPLSEVTPDWLDHELAHLAPDHELAMDSLLRFGRREMHIPMVDFAADVIRESEVIAWAEEHLGLTLRLFDSGRSFHAYGAQPISTQRWTRLMGLLLLANQPNHPPLVDARWVGHRLLAGYSALRWSRNSQQYLRMPTALATSMPPSNTTGLLLSS